MPKQAFAFSIFDFLITAIEKSRAAPDNSVRSELCQIISIEKKCFRRHFVEVFLEPLTFHKIVKKPS